MENDVMFEVEEKDGLLIHQGVIRVPYTWAAGEVADSVFRQAITSAGMGAAAAIQAQRWLDEQEEEETPLQEPLRLGWIETGDTRA